VRAAVWLCGDCPHAALVSGCGSYSKTIANNILFCTFFQITRSRHSSISTFCHIVFVTYSIFFYRIRVIEITLPPLRDRREDIPLLADHFLKQYSEGQVGCAMIPGHIIEALCTYDWPGNVRELQNEVQRYLSEQRLEFIGDVQAMSATQDDLFRPGGDLANLALPEALEAFEKRVIVATLAQNQWKTKATADILGITQRSLQRKIKKYHLT